MLFVFLSVVAIAAAGLKAFRWHLDSKPAGCTPEEFAAMKLAQVATMRSLSSVANKVGMTVRFNENG